MTVDTLKLITAIAGAALLFAAAVFGLNYLGYANIAFFAPKMEEVRRDTMIQSRFYQEATLRRLYDMKREYLAATPEGQAALKAAVLHEASSFDRSRLPADLRSWLDLIDR